MLWIICCARNMGTSDRNLLCTLMCVLLSVSVLGSEIGDKVSKLIRTFANDSLGTGEMQRYVSEDVTFVTEHITASTVEKIANDMSAKLGRRLDILRELQQDIAESYKDTDELKNYQTCCNIELKEDSSFLNAKVNLENWCLLGDVLESESPPQEMLPSYIMEKIRSKYTEEDGLKYIYYGSEDGILYNFPGIKYCGSYDPRFRPWYVQTATPESKDVVIVIDRSGSMKSSISSGGKTLMEVAIDAAITVVDTLNPDDRVGIVTFSTSAETPPGVEDSCFSTSLAKANSQNKKYLRSFIAAAIPDGETYYNAALNKAFQYFQNADKDDVDAGHRDKVILFLTDGIPTDDEISIYRNLSNLNAQQHNEVVLLTYFLSTSSSDRAEQILTNIANQTFHDASFGNVKRGKFTHVSNPDNLRNEMASFYELFKLDEDESKPSFSTPFLDTFNTSNIQISMCLPVKLGEHIKGVVCIDQSVDDLLSEITYFKKGDLAYAFVIDSQARVLSHPLLTNPADITADPVFVELPSLEVAQDIDKVVKSMTSGESGSMVLQSVRVTPRGSLYTEGVDTQRIGSDYYWHPVQGTNFSVCVVSSKIDEHERIEWNKAYPQEFIYHLNRVYDQPYATCRLFAREALRDLGNVKFSPRAFVDPYTYTYGQETTSDLKAYEDYFTGRNDTNPGFRSGVREDVALSFRFEELMEAKDEYADYAIWRYIATELGIIRIFPGSEVPVMFDALVRSWKVFWYIRSMNAPKLYTISTPYNDALGAGIVLTISKAILTPSEDAAVGVIGVDFTLAYLHLLLTQQIKECTTYECIIMDQSGFIVLHSTWLKPVDGHVPVIEGVHISSQEPEIAYDLVKQNALRAHACINVEALNEQVFWKFKRQTSTDPSWYELHEIPETNVFLIIKKGPASQTEECHCPETQAVEMCSLEDQTCFCPCYHPTDVYSYCSGVFHLTEDGNPPCSPPVPSIDFSYISKREADIVKNLDICRDYQCNQRNVRSACVGVASCSWCAYKEDGSLLDNPYCSTWDKCAFGIGPERQTDPPPVVHGGDGLKPGIIALIVILALAAIIAAVVVTIFILKKRQARNENHSIGRSNTTPNPYFGMKGAQGGEQKDSSNSTDCSKSGGYVTGFKLQHTSMPVGVAPERPKSMCDDEVYDMLRESHLLPLPPDELLDGFKPRPRPESLPPTPPPEELPDNYNDDLMDINTDTNTLPLPNYEASKYGTSDETGRERSDSDVYLKPKSLTMSKSSDYSGLQSGERTQPGTNERPAASYLALTGSSETPKKSSENEYLKFQSVSKPDGTTNEEHQSQRKQSDVYLKAQSVSKPDQTEQDELPRESYKRLIDAYPEETVEKY